MSRMSFESDDMFGSRGSHSAILGLLFLVLLLLLLRTYRAVNRCTFDQARLIRHNQILAANGIAPDGKP